MNRRTLRIKCNYSFVKQSCFDNAFPTYMVLKRTLTDQETSPVRNWKHCWLIFLIDKASKKFDFPPYNAHTQYKWVKAFCLFNSLSVGLYTKAYTKIV